jgi:hypothetical protein
VLVLVLAGSYQLTRILYQVAYQRILQLTYVEDLLITLKTLFIKLFEPFLTTFVASLHALNSGPAAVAKTVSGTAAWSFTKAFDGWDAIFDKLLRGLEEKAAQVCDHLSCTPAYKTPDCRTAALARVRLNELL